MAKSPLIEVDAGLVKRAEAWIDERIVSRSQSFERKRSVIEESLGSTLSEEEWQSLCEKYKAAGWSQVSFNHWKGQENGDGPYFGLWK